MSEWRYDESSGSFRRSDGYRRKNDNDWGSWALIVFLFLVGAWPVGLWLLIAKLADTPAPARKPAAQSAKSPAGSRVGKAAKKVTQTPSDTDGTAKLLQIVGGAVMAFLGIGALFEAGGLFGGALNWSALFSELGAFAGGAAMFLSGRRMMRRRDRVARYRAVMGERDFVAVAELAAVAGKKQSVVERDVEYMVRRNLLGVGAFYDAGRGVLFRSADAY